jgi:hypothetical protein
LTVANKGVPAEALRALFEPFPPEAVSWRVGSTTKDKTRGLALAYIDARDVMNRLDAVCGPGNWSDYYDVDWFPGDQKRMIVTCTLSIRVDGEWVSKSDAAENTDIEAVKGSHSDAFKRAAVKWGVGRYLYDTDSLWVEIENNQIKASELPRLRARLATPGVIVVDPEQPKPTEAVTAKQELIAKLDKAAKSLGLAPELVTHVLNERTHESDPAACSEEDLGAVVADLREVYKARRSGMLTREHMTDMLQRTAEGSDPLTDLITALREAEKEAANV